MSDQSEQGVPRSDVDGGPVRVVLDFTYIPGTDPNDGFVCDDIMEMVNEHWGYVTDARTVWAGPEGQPVGNIPWKRTPSEHEQSLNDQARQQLEAEAQAAEPE